MALGIVAYRDGGAAAVGLVGLLRMLPSAICAPLLSPFADRGRRERVLVVVSTARGVATGAAAVVAALGGAPALIYALAVLSTIAATLFRPAHSALLPSLCHTGHELASANVVRGMLDSAATLVGPLLAAVILEVADVDVVFGVAAAASLWSAALLLRLDYDAPPRPPATGRRLGREVVEGVVAVVRNRDVALVLGLAAAQSFTRGALTVFSVVVSIELLGRGEPGAGTLMTAVGVGAVVGSLAASLLVGTRRLGAWFALGVTLWGLPLVLVGLVPRDLAALFFLALIGGGNALIDVAGFTLLGRMAPDAVLARVFGVPREPGRRLHRGRRALRRRSPWTPWKACGPPWWRSAWSAPPWRPRRGGGCARSTAPSASTTRTSGCCSTFPLRTLPLPSVEQLVRGLELRGGGCGCSGLRAGRRRRPLLRRGVRAGRRRGRRPAAGHPGRRRRVRRDRPAAAQRPGRRPSPRAPTSRLRSLDADCFLTVVLGYTPSAREAGPRHGPAARALRTPTSPTSPDQHQRSRK